jgi:hypothetical protein
MKNYLNTFLLALLSVVAYSQNAGYVYNGRSSASIKESKLTDAQLVSDLTPELWQKLGLSEKVRLELDKRRKQNYPLGYYAYPQGGYELIVEYVSVEIIANINGKEITATSTSDELNVAQKNILISLKQGDAIRIVIQFQYKNRTNDKITGNEIFDGGLVVTVVPEVVAEYPGGFKQLTDYLIEKVFTKIYARSTTEPIIQSLVIFTINEEGKAINIKMERTKGDATIDQLLLNALQNMPLWKPAKNAKGIKVKQEYRIPFGGDGC